MENTKIAGQTSDQSSLVEIQDLTIVNKKIDLDNYTTEIFSQVRSISRGFISIGEALLKVRSSDLLESNGYVDVYDYAEKTFGFKKTSTKNFIAVAQRFGDKQGSLLKEYEEYNLSQLIELLPEQDLSSYSPDLTIAQMRDIKKVQKSVREGVSSLLDYMEKTFKAWLTEIPDLHLVDFGTDANIGEDHSLPGIFFKGYYGNKDNKVLFSILYKFEETYSYSSNNTEDLEGEYLFSLDSDGSSITSYHDDTSLTSLLSELKDELKEYDEYDEDDEESNDDKVDRDEQDNKDLQDYSYVSSWLSSTKSLIELLESKNESLIREKFYDIAIDLFSFYLLNGATFTLQNVDFNYRIGSFLRLNKIKDFDNFHFCSRVLFYHFSDKEVSKTLSYFPSLTSSGDLVSSCEFDIEPLKKLCVCFNDALISLKLDLADSLSSLDEEKIKQLKQKYTFIDEILSSKESLNEVPVIKKAKKPSAKKGN